MKYPTLTASAVAFSSAVTNIAVNQQKNIIQHPYWGKIFPFQDAYAYISFKYKHLQQLHFYHFYIASIHFKQIIIQEFSYYYYKFMYANV